MPLDVIKDRLDAWLDDSCWQMVMDACEEQRENARRDAEGAGRSLNIEKAATTAIYAAGKLEAYRWMTKELAPRLKDAIKREGSES